MKTFTFIIFVLVNGSWEVHDKEEGLPKVICELGVNMNKKVYEEAQAKNPEIKGKLRFECVEE